VQRRHMTDDQVEAFVRDKVAGPALARMEQHLLLCDPCQRRVEKLSRLVADLRAAVSAIGLLGMAPQQRPPRRLDLRVSRGVPPVASYLNTWCLQPADSGTLLVRWRCCPSCTDNGPHSTSVSIAESGMQL